MYSMIPSPLNNATQDNELIGSIPLDDDLRVREVDDQKAQVSHCSLLYYMYVLCTSNDTHSLTVSRSPQRVE